MNFVTWFCNGIENNEVFEEQKFMLLIKLIIGILLNIVDKTL